VSEEASRASAAASGANFKHACGVDDVDDSELHPAMPTNAAAMNFARRARMRSRGLIDQPASGGGIFRQGIGPVSGSVLFVSVAASLSPVSLTPLSSGGARHGSGPVSLPASVVLVEVSEPASIAGSRQTWEVVSLLQPMAPALAIAAAMKLALRARIFSREDI